MKVLASSWLVVCVSALQGALALLPATSSLASPVSLGSHAAVRPTVSSRPWAQRQPARRRHQRLVMMAGKRIIIAGAPASGKGTQVSALRL
jgi:type IV secretory pathway ATPase VirB11/archaellum biosynthesis ATPase